MICAPVVALFQAVGAAYGAVTAAVGGALSTAIGGAISAEILGGAVMGLITSGGNPLGAVLGGLGGAMGGGIAGGGETMESMAAMADAAGASYEAASTVGQLASDTIGNSLTEMGDLATTTMESGSSELTNQVKSSMVGDSGSLATEALTEMGPPSNLANELIGPSENLASPGPLAEGLSPPEIGSSDLAKTNLSGSQGLDVSKIGDATTRDMMLGKTDPMTGAANSWSMDATGDPFTKQLESWAKKHPMLTKMGMGAVKGMGELSMKRTLMKQQYKSQADAQIQVDQSRSDRAYRGMSTSLPFRPRADVTPGPIGAQLGGA